jgi:hypothetical protein
VLNTLTAFFFFYNIRRNEREKRKEKKAGNLVVQEIVMFNLMKISHTALATDFSDEKKN